MIQFICLNSYLLQEYSLEDYLSCQLERKSFHLTYIKFHVKFNLGIIYATYLVLEMHYPWMNKHFHKWQSLIWMLHKDFFNQISIVFSASFLEFDVTFDDFSSNFDLITSEWSSAMNQFVEQNTERPYVDLVVVWLRSDHFWRHILQCATECVSLLFQVTIHAGGILSYLGFYTPSKIANL